MSIDHWEDRYTQPGYHFGTAPNAFLAAQAHRLRPGQSALSIADGEGRNGVWLAEQGLSVTSQDFSPTAQTKARALAEERGVTLTFVHSDLQDWVPPRAQFDVVVGIFFQFAAPDWRPQLFQRLKDALRPGGLMLIQGYGPKQLEYRTGGPGILENLYTPDLLRDAFADLVELEITEYDAELQEGAGHHGRSALVDLIGRKAQD